MSNWQDQLWMWRGWQVGKWIFSLFLLIFILSQIWFSYTIKSYDIFLVDQAKSFKVNLPALSLPEGFFKQERMIK